SNPSNIGAQMPGSVTEVKVSVGETVTANQPLLITEAMKMATTIQAPFAGVIKQLTVNNGDTLETVD
ncbi:biotin/lipoyl-containing protein, partial [Staphylococcus aureus]|uniref:biotin/lipoyl-containing protein n=1 Tax=Staphylococcus aureus TaxID=1280 RepID=UPI0010233F8D